jgi:hypothetical protein
MKLAENYVEHLHGTVFMHLGSRNQALIPHMPIFVQKLHRPGNIRFRVVPDFPLDSQVAPISDIDQRLHVIVPYDMIWLIMR